MYKEYMEKIEILRSIESQLINLRDDVPSMVKPEISNALASILKAKSLLIEFKGINQHEGDLFSNIGL